MYMFWCMEEMCRTSGTGDSRSLVIMFCIILAPAGVIVVGSANCNLHPSALRLTIERFTHRTVQRALLVMLQFWGLCIHLILLC